MWDNDDVNIKDYYIVDSTDKEPKDVVVEITLGPFTGMKYQYGEFKFVKSSLEIEQDSLDVVYEFDIIHAHDQVMLNIAVKLKKITGKRIIYDSHELFRCWPLNTSAKGFTMLKSKIVRRILINREAKNIKKIDGLITVNESIRNDINTHFHLNIPSIFKKIRLLLDIT